MKRMFISLFAAAQYAAISLAPSTAFAKEVSEKVIKRVEEVSSLWRKTYKADEKTYAALQEQLHMIQDVGAVLTHSELDAGLRASLEKIREDSFKRIEAMDEKVVPHLVQDYVSTIRDRYKPKEKLSREGRTALARSIANRYIAIEDALNMIGVKAIPALTDLHSKAAKLEAGLVTERTKELIARIVKKSDLEAEKIRVQMEISRIGSEKGAREEVPAAAAHEEADMAENVKVRSSKPVGNVFEESQQKKAPVKN